MVRKIKVVDVCTPEETSTESRLSQPADETTRADDEEQEQEQEQVQASEVVEATIDTEGGDPTPQPVAVPKKRIRKKQHVPPVRRNLRRAPPLKLKSSRSRPRRRTSYYHP